MLAATEPMWGLSGSLTQRWSTTTTDPAVSLPHLDMTQLVWPLLPRLPPSRVPKCSGAAHGAGWGFPATGCVQRAIWWDPVYRAAPHWWNHRLAQQHGGWIRLGGPGCEQLQQCWKHLSHHHGEKRWRRRMKTQHSSKGTGRFSDNHVEQCAFNSSR